MNRVFTIRDMAVAFIIGGTVALWLVSGPL